MRTWLSIRLPASVKHPSNIPLESFPHPGDESSTNGKHLGRAFCPGGSPREGEFLLSGRTISKIQVDQRLIPNSCLLRKSLEIADRAVIEPDGDLALEPLRIRIALRSGEIVFLPHRFHLSKYFPRSVAVAFRAEIRRMTSPEAR